MHGVEINESINKYMFWEITHYSIGVVDNVLYLYMIERLPLVSTLLNIFSVSI